MVLGRGLTMFNKHIKILLVLSLLTSLFITPLVHSGLINSDTGFSFKNTNITVYAKYNNNIYDITPYTEKIIRKINNRYEYGVVNKTAISPLILKNLKVFFVVENPRGFRRCGEYAFCSNDEFRVRYINELGQTKYKTAWYKYDFSDILSKNNNLVVKTFKKEKNNKTYFILAISNFTKDFNLDPSITEQTAYDFSDNYFLNTTTSGDSIILSTNTTFSGYTIGQVGSNINKNWTNINWTGGNYTTYSNVTMQTRTKINTFCSNFDCTNLVSWWGLDGVGTDLIGSNDGTINGATITNGYIGDALNFVGTNGAGSVDDNVDLGVNANLKLTGNLTVGAWVYAPLGSEGGMVVAATVTPYGYDIWINKSGYPRIEVDTVNDALNASYGTSDIRGAWHYLVITYNTNSTNALYVDGVKEASISNLVGGNLDYDATDHVYIGTRADGFSFTGKIDEVRIWNRSLSADEILNIYNNYTAGTADSNFTNWSAELTNNLGSTITSVDGRWLQYKGNFLTNDTNQQPTIDSVGISYENISWTDTTPPIITIQSPENITYNYQDIEINVSADETISTWILNWNGTNETFTPNTTKTFTEGQHTLIIYADDTAGNWNNSNVTFNVSIISPPNITFQKPTPNNESVFNNFLINVSVISWNNGNVTLFWTMLNGSNWTTLFNKTISFNNSDNSVFWDYLNVTQTEKNYTFYSVLKNSDGTFYSSNNTVYIVAWLEYNYGGEVSMTPIMLWIFLGSAFLFLVIAVWKKTPVMFWVAAGIFIVIAIVLLGQGVSVEAGKAINSTTIGSVTRTIETTQYAQIKNVYTNGLAIILSLLAIYLAIASFWTKEYLGD